MILVGLLAINTGALAQSGEEAGNILLGILAAAAGLGIWVAYALLNEAVVRGPEAPDALPWTALQGIGAGLGGPCCFR
jgi:drug/metabolite transporter (DMT)-like permease